MHITSTQVQKILTGDYKFKLLPFSMMVTRLKMFYRHDQSQRVLKSCEDEINAFVRQYETIMRADLDAISDL
jgi:hypothetical protein